MSSTVCIYVFTNKLPKILILVFRSHVLIETIELIIPKFSPILSSLCLMYYLTLFVFLSLKIIFILKSTWERVMELSHGPDNPIRVQLMNIPTRVCQTCGVAKSLDHFVSMYTEASTSNCDLCRQHQREAYRCMHHSFVPYD